MIRQTFSVALLLSAFALSPAVRAGDAATAEVLFRDGRALMEAGDYAAACPKLSESYAQDPATGTLLALAMCREAAGQTASAWATYAEVASRAKQDGRQDREQAARERMAALEPKLSRLTIAVDPETARVPGLVVERDGKAVGKGAWDTGVPVDPGEHIVEVTAPGKHPWSATITVGAEADTQTLQVPVLEDAPADAAEPQHAVAVGEGDMADAGVSADGPPLRTIGLIAGGVGLVGLGVGGFFGLRAKSLNNESMEDCDANNECGPIGGAKRDDAKSAANLSTVAFIAGGVLTAAGVTLFLVGGPKDGKATARIEATPVVGLGEAAMVVRGQF